MSTYNIDVYYCDQHGIVSVITGSANPSSCLTQGTTYNVSAAADTLRVPFTCCVDSLEYDSGYGISHSISNSYFELHIPQNGSGSERTFTIKVNFCDENVVDIYVVQSNLYERWVQIPIDEDYECDDCDAYKLRAVYADTEEYATCDDSVITSDDIKKGKDILTAEIGDCVTEIDSNAFKDCIALSEIDFGNGVQTISSNAFNGCLNLREIEFPNSLETISTSAFCWCRNLSEINLPEGVTEVGSDAFFGCSGVTSITIPSTLSSMTSTSFRLENISYDIWYDTVDSLYIGSPTYLSTAALKQKNARNVTIGGSVTSIPTNCFNSLSTSCHEWTGNMCVSATCSGITSLTIESSVTEISKAAFQGCTGLKNVTLPNTLTTIGESAFKDCSGLTSIVIPSGVTSIGNYALWNYDCVLTSITFLSEYPPQIGASAFTGCSELKIFVPNEYVENYLEVSSLAPYINNLVEVHPDNYKLLAYASDSNLNNVYQECDGTDTLTPLPSSLYKKLVFGNCISTFEDLGTSICSSSLGTIEFSSAITTIHDSAFASCRWLTSVVLPDNTQLSTIGDYAFDMCVGLSGFTVPSGVTSIGDGAFRYTSALTEVTFEEGSRLTSIGAAAFDCHTRATGYERSAIKSINIPSGVTSIGSSAFTDCIYLTSVTFDSGSQLSAITDKCFYGTNSLEGSITIPSGVTTIGERAFEIDTQYPYNYSDQKLRRLYFENGSRLASIGTYAFNNRYNLDFVELPEGLVTINDVAFYNNRNLHYAIIPSTVTTIGEGAFAYCLALQYVVCNATTPPTISSHTFYNGDAEYANTYTIYVPSASVETYKSAWSSYASRIQAIPSELPKISDMIEVYYANGESAYTFPLYDKSIYYPTIEGNEIVALNFGSGVTKISGIPSSVTSITFESGSKLESLEITGSKIKSISIPSGVTYSVPYGRTLNLSDNTELSSVSFDEGSQLASIGDGAFSGCTSLRSIAIPNAITSIGSSAFTDCTSLSSATIGSGVTSIGKSAFQGCSGLTNVTFAEGSQLTTIEQSVFANCRSLSSITLPDSVTSIGMNAFNKCYSLSSFTVPSSITTLVEDTIGSTFPSCANLTSVTFPEDSSLEEFSFSTFSQTNVVSIVLPSGLTSLYWYYAEYPSIRSVTFTSETPPTNADIDSRHYRFTIGGNYDFKIYVPSSAVNTYKESADFANFKDVIYPIP